MEMAVVVAVAVLFSTFSTPVMSSVLTFGVWVAGHLTSDINNKINIGAEHAALGIGEKNAEWLNQILKLIYYAIPNLENFNIKGRVVYGAHVPLDYVSWMSLYGFFWDCYFLNDCNLVV